MGGISLLKLGPGVPIPVQGRFILRLNKSEVNGRYRDAER
jgi:hypothetical protein